MGLPEAIPYRAVPVFDSGRTRLILELWPVAIVDIQRGATKEHYVGLLEAVDTKVVARREPYIIVTDAVNMGGAPPADVRKVISEWMKKNAHGHTSLGSVTIVGSPIIRGALTALYWLFTPPNPQGVAGTWMEARDWAVEKLRAGDCYVPPKLLIHDRKPY
jgi:hypothetical protein